MSKPKLFLFEQCLTDITLLTKVLSDKEDTIEFIHSIDSTADILVSMGQYKEYHDLACVSEVDLCFNCEAIIPPLLKIIKRDTFRATSLLPLAILSMYIDDIKILGIAAHIKCYKDRDYYKTRLNFTKYRRHSKYSIRRRNNTINFSISALLNSKGKTFLGSR